LNRILKTAFLEKDQSPGLPTTAAQSKAVLSGFFAGGF
jgi:hypothetical protein